MSILLRFITIFVATFIVAITSVNASNWVVSKVRQPAVYSSDGKAWVKLDVGMTLPSSSWVNTGRGGRLVVKRGKEFIQFKPNTMAAIAKRDRAGKKTLIRQKFGELLLDVETRKRKHLKVETPFLAAVVKGTRFSVKVGKKSAKLSVERGVVEVTDERNGLKADIRTKQSVKVINRVTTTMRVLGPGPKAPIAIVKRSEPKVRALPSRGNIISNILGLTKDKNPVAAINSAKVNGKTSTKTNNGVGSSASNGNSGNSNAGGNSNGNGNSGNSNAGGNGNGNGKN
jgi:hypothetical protein